MDKKHIETCFLGFSFKYADIAKVFRSLALQYPLNSTSVVSRVK